MDLLRGRITVAEAMTEVNGRAVFGSPRRTNGELSLCHRSCVATFERPRKDTSPDDFADRFRTASQDCVPATARQFVSRLPDALCLFCEGALEFTGLHWALSCGELVVGDAERDGEPLHRQAVAALERRSAFRSDSLSSANR